MHFLCELFRSRIIKFYVIWLKNVVFRLFAHSFRPRPPFNPIFSFSLKTHIYILRQYRNFYLKVVSGMKVLISTCLLGVACKYSGGDNARPALVAALQAAGHELVPVCPEVYGGLPTPRTPAERIGSRVVTAAGADVTAQYRKGAEIALQLARLTGCRVAVLKANSPSCGHGTIYDGTFSGKKISGSGVAAELLEQNGIAVYTDEDCAAALPF